MDLKELAKTLAEKDDLEFARDFPLFVELLKLKKSGRPQKSGVFWVPLSR